ncbi:MAG: ATP-dependent nuclease, partial [Cyanobium sp.]
MMDEQRSEQRQQLWFSGFFLEGELAGLYEMEGSGKADPVGSQAAAAGAKQHELVLDGLAAITIFVGANNSGKSRLLRGIFGDPQFVRFIQLGGPGSRDVAREMRSLLDEASSISASLITKRSENLQTNGFPGSISSDDGWIAVNVHERLGILWTKFERERDLELIGRVNHDTESLDLAPQSWRGKCISAINLWEKAYRKIRKDTHHAFLHLPRYYIPMLRGMRPFTPSSQSLSLASEEGKDAYTQRTHRDYFSTYEWPSGDEGDSAKQQSELAFSRRPNIFTGIGTYADMQRRLLSPIHAERESIRTYEKLLSEQFFPGLPVTLTPALHGLDAQGKSISNDVVYLKIGYSEDRPIYDLGDGMQSLIICTYPIITELNEGSLFFIEEPDLGMHPSLQRVFLNVLREYHRKKGHQFFLTTHSNHLLDLLEDDPLVSIFSFSSIESEPAKSSEDTETSAQETTPA